MLQTLAHQSRNVEEKEGESAFIVDRVKALVMLLTAVLLMCRSFVCLLQSDEGSAERRQRSGSECSLCAVLLLPAALHPTGHTHVLHLFTMCLIPGPNPNSLLTMRVPVLHESRRERAGLACFMQ